MVKYSNNLRFKQELKGVKYLKDYKKKMAWLVVLCMIMNILVGNPYSMTLQARENKLVNGSVNVDGDGSEWSGLVQQGIAKKVGEGSVHNFGTVTTTAGALYLATDGADLYYYVEAQVPDWGEWGMSLDLGLYVEGQSGGQSKPAWSRTYEFAMEKTPQYHIMVQNRGSNGVAQAQLGTTGKSIDLAGQTQVDSSKGYEGKVKLSDLGITDSTNIYVMAVITGNQDDHTAFNVIPESSKNELATDYSANPPKQLGEYTERFEVEFEKPAIPEYISPEVDMGMKSLLGTMRMGIHSLYA